MGLADQDWDIQEDVLPLRVRVQNLDSVCVLMLNVCAQTNKKAAPKESNRILN